MANLNNDEVAFKIKFETDEALKKIHDLNKENKRFREENENRYRQITKLNAAEGDHSVKIKRLKEEIEANTKRINENNRALEEERKKVNLSNMSAAQLGKELKNLKRELYQTSKATSPERYRQLESEIKKTEKAFAQARRTSQGFMASLLSLDKIGTSIKGFFMGIGMAITTQVIGAFKQLGTTIMDFEKANSKLASVLGSSFDGVSKLTEQAKYLGRTTTATASEVTGLQIELAKLGFSQEVIEQLTPATLKFAKAVDTDLSSAAAFAGAAMRMFNKDANDAESVLASFAVATTKSALDFSKLESSLSTVGPVANAFGFSLEETTALLGQLANAGFDASSAATATRNILLNLADTNGELAQALGGPVTNLDELVAGLQKLNSEGVDLAKSLELTDKRSVAAFSTFLNGADNILTLRDSITGCNEDFNQMVTTMTDNASGSWAGFTSAVEGLVLKFFDFREVLKTVFKWGTELVNWIGSVIDALSPFGTMLSAVAQGIGFVLSGLGQLIGWLSKLITNTYIGRGALNTLVATFAAYKIAVLLSSKAVKSFIAGLIQKIATVKLSDLSMKSATASTIAWTKALWANPFTLIASVLALVVSAVVSFCTATDEATESTDAWTEASRNAAKQYGEQKGKIEALIMIAENENLSLKRRQKAIAELNRIIPEYNAKIDKTTGKYTASKKALDAYLNSLEKELRYKANMSKMSELVAAAEEARDAYDEAQIKVMTASDKKNFVWQSSDKDKAREVVEQTRVTYEQAEKDLKNFKKRMNRAIKDGIITPPENLTDENTIETVLDKTNEKATETVTRLKEINAELKKLRKMDPQSDEELDRINRRIEALREEKKVLQGKNKTKHTPGTYREDSLDEATAPADAAHQKRSLAINKDKGKMSADKYTIAKNRELIRYSRELIAALDELKSKTDATHTQTLDKINAEQDRLNQQMVAAQQAIDKATVNTNEQYYKDRIAAEKAFYATQETELKKAVAKQETTQEAANVMMLIREKEQHEALLAIYQQYYDELEDDQSMSVEEWTKARKRIEEEMQKLRNSIITDAGKWSETIRSLTTNDTTMDGIKQKYAQQRFEIEQTYSTAIKKAGESKETIVALETEKQNRIAELNFQYQQEMFQLQEITGLTWAQEYEQELAQLEEYHRKGLVSEKNYQKQKLQLGVTNAKRYYDYYSQLAGSMFTAIQDAEIAQSDAKYDVLIQQAKNNGEDTAALEEEKENKKLEIQKKYADVNFAIKVSQIVADTAVSIMKAYSELGPIGGPIAAALLTVTGAAQIAAANAEREKIKNMQPGNTAGAAAAKKPTAERVLTGYSEGGYTGDGDRYEVAGVVHRGEYVVPKPIMDNPRVVDAVGMIEAIRRNRVPTSAPVVDQPMQGYADGGFTSAPSATDTAELQSAVRELREAIKNMRAYVVYKDIQNAADATARAQATFKK